MTDRPKPHHATFGDALRAFIGQRLVEDPVPFGVVASALEAEARAAREKQAQQEAGRYTAIAPRRTAETRPRKRFA